MRYTVEVTGSIISPTCEGKVVEIDGVKYKLSLV